MYFENNRRAAESRADADFLRRMLGGELSNSRADASSADLRGSANGSFCEWSSRSQSQREATSSRPVSEYDSQKPRNTACPTEIPAPALAMVYSPLQCWRKLFEPEEGLKHGTIFSELALPFEAASNKRGKEGHARRLV